MGCPSTPVSFAPGPRWPGGTERTTALSIAHTSREQSASEWCHPSIGGWDHPERGCREPQNSVAQGTPRLNAGEFVVPCDQSVGAVRPHLGQTHSVMGSPRPPLRPGRACCAAHRVRRRIWPWPFGHSGASCTSSVGSGIGRAILRKPPNYVLRSGSASMEGDGRFPSNRAHLR